MNKKLIIASLFVVLFNIIICARVKLLEQARDGQSGGHGNGTGNGNDKGNGNGGHGNGGHGNGRGWGRGNGRGYGYGAYGYGAYGNVGYAEICPAGYSLDYSLNACVLSVGYGGYY